MDSTKMTKERDMEGIATLRDMNMMANGKMDSKMARGHSSV